MKAQTFAGGPGYLFVLFGVILALLSAMVPHYDAGHHLQFSVFAAGLLPWLLYGFTVPLLRSMLIDVCGLLLLIAHGWLVVCERFMEQADYSDNMIYLIPTIFAVLLLPFVIVILLRMWRTTSE